MFKYICDAKNKRIFHKWIYLSIIIWIYLNIQIFATHFSLLDYSQSVLTYSQILLSYSHSVSYTVTMSSSTATPYSAIVKVPSSIATAYFKLQCPHIQPDITQLQSQCPHTRPNLTQIKLWCLHIQSQTTQQQSQLLCCFPMGYPYFHLLSSFYPIFFLQICPVEPTTLAKRTKMQE